jgi:hypothetical protein
LICNNLRTIRYTHVGYSDVRVCPISLLWYEFSCYILPFIKATYFLFDKIIRFQKFFLFSQHLVCTRFTRKMLTIWHVIVFLHRPRLRSFLYSSSTHIKRNEYESIEFVCLWKMMGRYATCLHSRNEINVRLNIFTKLENWPIGSFKHTLIFLHVLFKLFLNLYENIRAWSSFTRQYLPFFKFCITSRSKILDLLLTSSPSLYIIYEGISGFQKTSRKCMKIMFENIEQIRRDVWGHNDRKKLSVMERESAFFPLHVIYCM